MEVRFQNFRCFKDTGRIPIRPITLLVGENSSGKTSFLAGLNHLFALLNGSQIDLNTPPFELGSFRDISFRGPRGHVAKSFTYQYFSEQGELATRDFEDDKGDSRLKGPSFEASDKQHLALGSKGLNLHLKLSPKQRNLLQSLGFSVRKRRSHDVYSVTPPKGVKESKPNFRVKNLSPNVFRHGRVVPLLLESWIEQITDRFEENGNQKNKEFRPGSMFFNFDRQIRIMLRRVSSPFRNYKAFAPIRETPQRVYLHENSVTSASDVKGERTAITIMKSKQGAQKDWDILSEGLCDFGRKSGLFEEIYPYSLVKRYHYPFEIRLRTKRNQVSNLCDVGYGVSQILPLLVELILSDRLSGFLLQQPEVHLHPKAQAEFGSLIANFAKKGRHFIIETHSDFIIERIGLEIKNETLRCDDVGILFFEAGESEVLVHNVELGADGSPKKAPSGYRKFFLEEFRRLWG